MICPKCNAQLGDDAKFCISCGAKIEAPVEEIPVAEVKADEPFVEEVSAMEENTVENAAVVEEIPVIEAAPVAEETKTEEKTPKKYDKKRLFTFGGLAVGAVAVIVIIAIIIGSIFFNKPHNYVLYIKDNELYYSAVSNLKPLQVTDELYDSDIFSDEDVVDSAYEMSYYTILSKDGSTIFFVDKIDEDDEGMNIYYRSTKDENKEPEKVASKVTSFTISENGKIVTYKKNGNLYQSNLKDSEKIAKDVQRFYVSADGKKVVYTNDKETLYVIKSGKDKEKIDKSVSEFYIVDKNLKNIYYIKKGSLYKKADGKDREKISSKIGDIVCAYESGEVYYTTESSKKVEAKDYVKDPYASSDMKILAQGEPEYPSYWDYDDWDEYDAAYDKYWEDYEAYSEAQERQELREEIDGLEIELNVETLNYYDGKKSIKIDSNFLNVYTGSDKKPVVVYSRYDLSKVEKVHIDMFDGAYSIEEVITDSIRENGKYMVAIKGETFKIKHDDAAEFEVSEDGETLIYMAKYDYEEYVAKLYKVEISNKLGEAKEYAKNVRDYSSSLVDNDTIIYFKDVDEETYHGDLYVNGKKVDNDVYIYSCEYAKESKTVYYMTDCDEEDGYGTLKCYKNKKDVKISDDVATFRLTPGGEVVYLYEYDKDELVGELYIYKNNKAQKIDDDVMAIVNVIVSEYRYNFAY